MVSGIPTLKLPVPPNVDQLETKRLPRRLGHVLCDAAEPGAPQTTTRECVCRVTLGVDPLVPDAYIQLEASPVGKFCDIADIIRRAMIRMPTAIAGIPAKMLLQVHDELIFEVEAGAVDTLIDAARAVMENASDPAVKLDVKLVVDAGHGANWAQAH